MEVEGIMRLVSVIIPSYNEACNLPAFYEVIARITADLSAYDFEFLFVDDGSTDDTMPVLFRLRQFDRRVKVLRLSRNFGSHAACLAGLMSAQGEFTTFLAADLQDPPEVISELLAKIEEGFDVVYAVRSQRYDPRVTVWFANAYNRLMRRYAIPSWPMRGTDVFMIRRAVADVVIRWRQKNTSIFAQMLWVGFRQAAIGYTKQRRGAGLSKWTLAKKLKLLADSFVSFSFSPIRLISYSGMALSAVGFAYALFIVLDKLFRGMPVQGWASLMVVLLLVSGFQLLTLGVIGEYLWRVADEVRGAPPFVIESRLGMDAEQTESRDDTGWHQHG
jgi:polyisoprenyl-phosphate glycosyltransferase